LPENKFSATMTTTHTALRADKTEQKVELRSSKNASLNKKPSGLIAIAQLIMCCKTINNNFRNLKFNYIRCKIYARGSEFKKGVNEPEARGR
jgi:hypothetical protein